MYFNRCFALAGDGSLYFNGVTANFKRNWCW
jgi:hypothetical protein